jgi:hypothetical protein
MKFAMENFSRPEFLQSLIHVGKNQNYEYTKPLLIFKQKNILRFAFFKNKQFKNHIKNAKKLLNMGIFGKFDEKLTKTNLFYKPAYLSDSDFIYSFVDAIIESIRVESNYKTTYSDYQNIVAEDGEYIGKASSIFYFSAEFIDGKFTLKMYAILKNGREVSHDFVAELKGFEEADIIDFYNQILDYIFDDNVAEYLKN